MPEYRNILIVLRIKERGSAPSLMGQCVCAQSPSRVQLFATQWTVAHQAPLSMGFSRQEYWSGLPFPPPGDLPNPGMEPLSPALADMFFTVGAIREAPMGRGRGHSTGASPQDQPLACSQGSGKQRLAAKVLRAAIVSFTRLLWREPTHRQSNPLAHLPEEERERQV